MRALFTMLFGASTVLIVPPLRWPGPAPGRCWWSPAVASSSPGRGYSWGMATFHPTLPRGTRIRTKITGALKEILVGPAHENDGTLNLMGALRMSMATTGYENIKEFQKAEIMVAPSLHTEGKFEQHSQGVGMGH